MSVSVANLVVLVSYRLTMRGSSFEVTNSNHMVGSALSPVT